MARIVNEEAYATRRNAILDAAQKLIYTRGYEQMTIQDILDELQMSKGAFYHYFGSKLAVLDALRERDFDEIEHLLLPIVRDPDLSALAKLQRFFTVSVRWKTVRRDYMLHLARALYADENILYRQKMRVLAIAMCGPMLAEIFRQGIREGVLDTAYPDLAGEMIMALLLDMGESLVPKVLAGARQCNGSVVIPHDVATEAMQMYAAYGDALERILGAPRGSVTMVDAETWREWEGVASETSLATP